MPSSAPRSLRAGLLVALLGSTLAACSGDYYVPEVRMLKTDGGTYNLALQQGYADVAQWKQDERNWADSELMLAKARAAAAGSIPTMEDPPNDAMKALRKQVDDALTQGRIDHKPVDAAMAQVAYDCLVRSVFNPPHPEGAKTHSCQTMFDEAMTSLAATPELAPPSEPIAVYFERNKADVNDTARTELKKLAAQIVDAKARTVVISGYSDSTGSLAANIVMAQKRVTAVNNILIEAGVPADTIKQMVYGEEDPSLPAAPPPTLKGPKSAASTKASKDVDAEAMRRRVTVSFNQ